MFLEDCLLCYQLSCHKCFCLAIVCKFVAAKILLQLWKQTNRRAMNSPYTIARS